MIKENSKILVFKPSQFPLRKIRISSLNSFKKLEDIETAKITTIEAIRNSFPLSLTFDEREITGTKT